MSFVLAAASTPVGFSTFYLFATAMAVGIAAFLALIPIRQIGRKFFILMSLIAVVFYSLAIVSGDRGLGALHLTAAGLLIAFNVFLSPKGGPWSVGLLVAAAVAGGAGLFEDARRYADLPLNFSGPPVLWLFLSFLSSAMVLGGVTVSMVLGHWYLVGKNLSFAILGRVTLAFAVSLGLRILVAGSAGWLQASRWTELWSLAGGATGFFLGSGIFVMARVLFGLILPVAGCYMVRECVKIRSNQSATGILYVLLAFVLIGEVIAKHLLISNLVLL